MKIAARCLIVLVMLAAASFAFAHPWKSKMITTSPLMISVADEQVLHIKNFSQEGGTDRAVVSVTFTGENGGTANVLTAIRIDLSTGGNAQNFPEIGNPPVIIAGPAQVTVAPVPGATLFISYRKESNESGGGGGGIFVSASPTPGASATPTVFPIATPTATP